MKRLNIAFVCDSITHLTAGSMISTLQFAEQLKERGHTVIIFAAKEKNKREITFYKKMKVYRFPAIMMPGSQGQFLISFPRAAKVKQILLQEKIDIIHVTDPTPSALLSIKAAKELKIKIVAHNHAQPENVKLSFSKNKIFNNIFYKYHLWAYRNANVIICPSLFAQRLLKENNFKAKIAVISNGVDLSQFKPTDSSSFVKKYQLPKDYKRILSLGRLEPEKSIHTIIEAMPLILKKNKKVQLWIIGDGSLKNELAILSRRLGLEKNILFFGKLPHDEVVMPYNACDLFVLPSIAEVEGMVVLEAMACGKPIIVSDSQRSTSSLFVRNNGLLFQLQNPKDLAEKVLQLLNNDQLRENMGKQSIAIANEYSLSSSIDKLEKVYYSLVNDYGKK